MKKIAFIAITLLGIASISSCKKCTKCTISATTNTYGVYTNQTVEEKYCDDNAPTEGSVTVDTDGILVTTEITCK